MKPVFSNAEKVSDWYLQQKYQELQKAFRTFTMSNLGFMVSRFEKSLDQLMKKEKDNYEKLRDLIHLEQDFRTYLSSKELLHDIFRDTTVKCGLGTKAHWYRCICQKKMDVLSLIALLEGYRREKCFQQEDKIGFPEPNVEKILQLLTTQDIQLLKSDVSDYYERFFREQLLCFSVISFDAPFSDYIISSQEDHSEETAKEVHAREKHAIKVLRLLFSPHGNFGYRNGHYYYEETKLLDNFEKKLMLNSFMKVYWHFLPCGELPERFQKIVSQALYNEAYLHDYLQNELFWRVLCLPLSEVSFWNALAIMVEEEQEEATKMSSDTPMQRFSEMSLQQQKNLLQERFWADVDFSGADLTEVHKSVFDISHCNLGGTGACIHFGDTQPVVYYVKGKKVASYDLTESCFQSCSYLDLTPLCLQQFSFSGSTFDKEILQEFGFYLKGVSEAIREKFYRHIVPTITELKEILKYNAVDVLTRRYGQMLATPEWQWLLWLEEVFPGSLQELLP